MYQLLGEEQLNVLFEIGILIAYWNTYISFTFSDNSVDRQKLEITKKKKKKKKKKHISSRPKSNGPWIAVFRKTAEELSMV